MKGRLIPVILAVSLTAAACGYAQPEERSDGGLPPEDVVSAVFDMEQASDEDGAGEIYFEDEDGEMFFKDEDGHSAFFSVEQPDWGKGPYYLSQMRTWQPGSCLDEGYFNRSGERVDMICKDGTKLVFLNTAGSMDQSGYERVIDRSEYELIMVNHHFYDIGFQEDYLKDKNASADDGYYPQTAVRLLDADALRDMNQTDLSIACNEMYARHGRIYTDPFWNAVFTRKSWYHPVLDKEQFALKQDGLFNEFEKKNLEIIIQVELEKGFRVRFGENYRKPVGILDGTNLDLNGDGKKECISIDIGYSAPNRIGAYDVMLDPKKKTSCALLGRMYTMEPFIYTASLDGKTILLFMCGETEHGIPKTNIYAYRGGELELAGEIEAGDLEFMDDCFYAYSNPPYEGRTRYIYRDGMIMKE